MVGIGLILEGRVTSPVPSKILLLPKWDEAKGLQVYSSSLSALMVSPA